MQTHKPKLFLCGKEDDFLSSRSFVNYFDQFPKVHRHAVLVEDATHSWFKKEVALGGVILSWMRKQWEDDAKFQELMLPQDEKDSSKRNNSVRAASNIRQIPIGEDGGREGTPETVKKNQ